MTGTASIISDSADSTGKISHYFDKFSVWLCSKDDEVNAGCFLVDITRGGGSVLIPKTQLVPSGSFDLVIMSPQNKQEILTILRAEYRWVDDKSSAKHNKIGMEFQNLNSVKLAVIDGLTNFIASQKIIPVKCDLLGKSFSV